MSYMQDSNRELRNGFLVIVTVLLLVALAAGITVSVTKHLENQEQETVVSNQLLNEFK